MGVHRRRFRHASYRHLKWNASAPSLIASEIRSRICSSLT